MLYYYFFRGCLAVRAKITYRKTNRCINSGNIEAEECKVYCYKTSKIDLNYKLQLLASEYQKYFVKKVFLKILQNLHENTYVRVSFSHGLSSVISKLSVDDFEHE